MHKKNSSQKTHSKSKITPKTKIPNEIIEAWQETIIGNARFPKGTRISQEKPGTLIRSLAKYERKTLIDLWKTFTSERDQLTTKTLTGKKEAIAYLLGFHLANVARIIHTFDMASQRWNLSSFWGKQKKVRVIDLGCGSGAMAQANINYLTSIEHFAGHIQVRLIDGSSHLLDAATSIIDKMSGDINCRAHKGNLSSLIVDKYVSEEKVPTLINLGYVWNEIIRNKSALKKINKLFSAIISNEIPSLITIVEPGSQDQSRSTMRLRDELIEQGFMPLYPCPHTRSCPLLEKSRDWCYSEIVWAHPPIQKFIDTQIGIERNVLAASTFLYASPALLDQLHASTKNLNIVVGRPTRAQKNTTPEQEKTTTKVDYLVCTEKGVVKTPLLPNAAIVRRGQHLDFPDKPITDS